MIRYTNLPLGRYFGRGSLSRHFSVKSKPFDKILIANRGEIACRVIRTAKKLGVKTVAIYSDADSAGMHVRTADEAYCVGPPPSKDSYLQMERIIEVAKKSNSQAIHPGYGFLSENAKFVDLVEQSGLVFIGPSSYSMNAMGDKINSKKIAKDAGCYVIPGFEGEVADEETAVRLSEEVGFPVMIKASAGGGGKGMRIAYNKEEAREGFRLSKAEALSSFGDDRMLIERYIENPHHIEIQVLADTHGNVVAFPERECSVQRRNQKVVEESPSCNISPSTRKAMQEQAIMLCKATKYRSAGTIEMLGDDKQNFFFLEMNTRLQVEHPITELVTNEDLVEHMLWIAAGKALPSRLSQTIYLPFHGSAIESRVYAEDPLRNFLPSIGPLITYKEPKQFSSTERGETVRIDTGVFEGGTISMHYDPMISKLCTHASTRPRSIELMEEALDQYVVQGLGNNLTFLRSVFRNDRFRAGTYSTKFIPTEYPDGFHGVQLSEEESMQFIAVAAAIHQARDEIYQMERQSRVVQTTPDLDKMEMEMEQDGAQNPGKAEFILTMKDPSGQTSKGSLATAGRDYRIRLELSDNLKVFISSIQDEPSKQTMIVLNNMMWQCEQPIAKIFIRKDSTRPSDEEEDPESDSIQRTVQYLGRPNCESFLLRFNGCDKEFSVRTDLEYTLGRYMLPPEVKDVSKLLLCPMPGTLISCSVKEGQRVEAGQQLAVIEAMKMQNVLRAEKAGVIKAIKKIAGSSLKVDEVILEFDS